MKQPEKLDAKKTGTAKKTDIATETDTAIETDTSIETDTWTDAASRAQDDLDNGEPVKQKNKDDMGAHAAA